MRQGITGKRKGMAGVWCSLLVAAGLIAWTAGPAAATAFSNAAAITIPVSGAATPYPSPITVSGLNGTIVDVNVTLTGVSHTYPDDIDALLVGPLGQNVVLMSDVGGSPDVTSIGLTFDDAAAASLPDEAQIVAGTFKPTAGVTGGTPYGFNGVAPAPAGPYGTTLSVFNGTAPNGTWNLFVYDDNGADSGSISGGWSLDILATPTITSFAPTSGKVGDVVVITGTSLTGTSAVKFNGTPAASFTVNSPTQITVTVPAGASTGPISLTTPDGTTASASLFVVRHARDVSLTLSGQKAKGTVNVTDGFSACGSGAPVKVQHFEHGHWKTLGSTLTKADGTYKVAGLTDSGKYRTVAKKITLFSGDVCLKDISPTAKK